MTNQQYSDEFLRLLTGSQRQLFVHILGLLPDQAAAEEVLQETNLIICREAASFTEGTNFLAWARAIALNQVACYVRDRGRDRHFFDMGLVGQLAEQGEYQSAVLAKMGGYLDECLRQQPPADRELLDQRYADSKAVQVIAAQRKTTPHAVSNRLYRIRRALRDCIRLKVAAEART